jgi:uncharacterized protein with ATP-grasp and redox domains
MKTALDCIPCLLRQALDAARMATADSGLHERLIRGVLAEASQIDYGKAPPVIAQRIHRRLRDISGVDDPYRDAKACFNRMALEIYPGLEARVSAAADPFTMAVRMAIAGNIIDLGVNGALTEDEACGAIDRVLSEPFVGDNDALKAAAGKAGTILYLADNAGEIVFDRLLIQRLGGARTTLAVRGHAIINDATRADAAAAGLHDICEVIDNGNDAPGTLLEGCSDMFRRRFEAADLIIAKGQGNYETLSDVPADIFFLFKVKCPVIAEHVGQPVGTQVLLTPAG